MQRRYRLRHKPDFNRLHRQGKRWFHPLAILIVQTSNLDRPRFGFTASRRVGRAVARNRAKRQFREAIRKRLGEVKAGNDCLLIISPRAVTASPTEIQTSVDFLLAEADLILVEKK